MCCFGFSSVCLPRIFGILCRSFTCEKILRKEGRKFFGVYVSWHFPTLTTIDSAFFNFLRFLFMDLNTLLQEIASCVFCLYPSFPKSSRNTQNQGCRIFPLLSAALRLFLWITASRWFRLFSWNVEEEYLSDNITFTHFYKCEAFS